jgi:hypothetical protein
VADTHPKPLACITQKLFQAVEEARALLAEGAAFKILQKHQEEARAAGGSRATRRAQQRAQETEQAAEAARRDLQLLTYPPPVREDFGKNSKLLLKWLRGAAVEPEVRSDQGRGRSECMQPP